jgi:Flp pilus assembly pilin Flp
MRFANRLYLRFGEGRGQTMGEYALLIGLIAVITVAAWKAFGAAIPGPITTVTSFL